MIDWLRNSPPVRGKVPPVPRNEAPGVGGSIRTTFAKSPLPQRQQPLRYFPPKGGTIPLVLQPGAHLGDDGGHIGRDDGFGQMAVHASVETSL